MNKLQRQLNGKFTELLLGDMYYELIRKSLQSGILPRYPDAIGKWYDPICPTRGEPYIFWDEGTFNAVSIRRQHPDFLDGGALYEYVMDKLIIGGKWKP